MQRIEELIKKLCPDGVEYKELNTLIDYIQPTRYIVKNTKYSDEYDIPVLTPGQTFILGYTNEKEGIYNASEENPIILFDDFTTAFRWIDFKFKVKSSAVKILIPKNDNINFRFAFFAMQTLKFDNTQHNRQWISKYSVLKIPVPPIEIQNEIVRILDNFSELEKDLEVELEARKKQYEYYEYNLLWNNQFQRVKLKDVCVVNQGLQIPISKRFKEQGENRYLYITVQFLKNKNEDQYYIENPDENVICKKEDILVTRTGSTGIIIKGIEGCFHNNFFKVNCNEKIDRKYMYCILKSKYMYNKMLAVASGGTVPDLPHKKFYGLEIPLPDIEKQKEIAEKLEKFDKLCNNISEGLPAEIEARRKQYEYYRDKLLDFKELKEEK